MIIKVPSKPTHSVVCSSLPEAGSVLRAAVPPSFCSLTSTGLSSTGSAISPGQHLELLLEQRGFVQAGGGACQPGTDTQAGNPAQAVTERANTAPGSSSPCSSKPLHRSALCSEHCSSQVLPLMLGPNFQCSNSTFILCSQAAQTLSV